MLFSKQRRLALDVSLGATTAPNPGIDTSGIEAEPVALGKDDPGKVFVVGFLEGVADGRKAVEAGRPGFRGLAFAQHDRERSAAFTAAQEVGQVVEGLDGKAECIQQLSLSLAQHSSCLAFRLGPVGTLRYRPLEFVKRQQPLVVEAGQRRFQRWQGLGK